MYSRANPNSIGLEEYKNKQAFVKARHGGFSQDKEDYAITQTLAKVPLLPTHQNHNKVREGNINF